MSPSTPGNSPTGNRPLGDSPLDRITLVSVSEVMRTTTGKPYFFARFKRGPLGRLVSRTLWGEVIAGGQIRWERASPEEVEGLSGQDLTGLVSVVAVDVEPKEITLPNTGEVRTITSMALVVFPDETVEQVARRYGVVLRAPEPHERPAAFPFVGANGQG